MNEIFFFFYHVCQSSLPSPSFLLTLGISARGVAVRYLITVFVYIRNACDFTFYLSNLEDLFLLGSHWWSEMEASE